MSYRSQYQLAADVGFQSRTQATLTEQGLVFKDDGRADIAALATDLLKGPNARTFTFVNLLAGSPGFADSVDQGEGVIDSSVITDPQLLSAVQALWPTVAGLFYSSDGTPIP